MADPLTRRIGGEKTIQRLRCVHAWRLALFGIVTYTYPASRKPNTQRLSQRRHGRADWNFLIEVGHTGCDNILGTGLGDSPDAQAAAGSVDADFAATAPEGKENPWPQTVPGKGSFTILRLYRALEPDLSRSS